jgi:ATP-dependent exoDNAse (exonuclease V) alpha subunit
MAADWNRTRLESPEGRTVMLTDASNKELDRLNAMAQEHRAANGELGAERVALPDRPYGVAAGDRIVFTAALNPPGQDRVHNGTQGTILDAKEDGALKIQTHGAKERDVDVDAKEFHDLRLAYAQHVYKAQGLTTDRALVLTGSWQTDRERSYVALSRARERTDIYVSRQDLGEQGMDAGAIERLGEAMARSNAQEASITRAEIERGGGAEPPSENGCEREPTPEPDAKRDQERESEAGRIMRESLEQHEREHGRGIDTGIG